MSNREAIKELQDYIDLPFGISISNETCKIAIQAIEELEQYRELGTLEQVREAVERSKTKKPNYDDYHKAGYRCPNCNNVNPWGYPHCKHCGQKLDWSVEE